MSKRCKLQKEYYKQFGNYKGEGKYSDHYVKWLENQILQLRENTTKMKPQHYSIKWNGYNCEVEAYVSHNDVEIEKLTFTKDGSDEPASEIDILSNLTYLGGGTVKNPIDEIETLVLEADAQIKQDIAGGTYFSSCD